MKAITALAVGLALTVPALASDIRTINNRSVDLQPIHDWRVAKGSMEDRPLKHWKDLCVVEIEQAITPSMHIVKVTVGGTTQVIALRNMPRDLAAKATRLQNLKAQVAGVQRGKAIATANATAAQMRASEQYYVSGSADYVNAVAANEQRRANQAAAATANAQLASANLDALKEEIATLTAEVGATTILAMPTGGTYAGKAQWDTGLK